MSSSDYLAQNQRAWASYASEYEAKGRGHWSAEAITWGIWSIPEDEVHLLPEVAGRDVLEVGCGTGYVSAWLARRGARPIGIDPTAEQLASATRFQREFGLPFPLVLGAGETLPFADASFDLVVSEYGAAIWADPYAWIPEAARVLRAGGELMFLGNGSLLMLCVDDDEDIPAGSQLVRDYFGMYRFEWPEDDPPAIEFHLGHGDWIRLLRANDLEVLDLVELRPPEGSTTSYPFVSLDWARRWPSEEVWKARKSR